MPISYSLIARLPANEGQAPVVLVEYSAVDANFKDIARELLKKAHQISSRKTFTAQEYMFHIQCERGLVFLCVADSEMGHRVPYNFLNDVKERFLATHPQEWRNARELFFNDSFARVLSDRMSFHSYDPEADKINRVKGEVNRAKSVMMENIDKVLQRGESIEVLVDKTERLDVSSQTFKVKSKQLERKMCCKNAKMTAVLIGVVVLLFLIILFVILYETGVFNSKPSATTTTTLASTTATTTTVSTTTTTTAAASNTTTTTAAPTTAP